MIDVHIPKLGMQTVEVDVTEIYVGPGSRVAVGDPLIQVDTEKVTNDITSEHAGVVTDIFVDEDETYEVGHVFCRIDPDA